MLGLAPPAHQAKKLDRPGGLQAKRDLAAQKGIPRAPSERKVTAGLGLVKSVTLTTLADQLCLCLCPFRRTWRRRGPTSAPGTGTAPAVRHI